MNKTISILNDFINNRDYLSERKRCLNLKYTVLCIVQYIIWGIYTYFNIRETMDNKISDRIFANAKVDLDTILTIITLFFAYIAILLTIYQWGCNKHSVKINDINVSKLFTENPLFKRDMLFCFLIYFALAVYSIIDGFIEQNYNVIAINIINLFVLTLIYFITHYSLVQMLPEELYYMKKIRPVISKNQYTLIKVKRSDIEKECPDLYESIIDITEHIKDGEDWKIYTCLFKELCMDLSTIRNWEVLLYLDKFVDSIYYDDNVRNIIKKDVLNSYALYYQNLIEMENNRLKKIENLENKLKKKKIKIDEGLISRVDNKKEIIKELIEVGNYLKKSMYEGKKYLSI